MRAIPVVEGVYRIPLAWGNAYLLTNGTEAALIDTGLKKDRPALCAAIREAGVTESQIRAVYLTHAHTDHAGNAAYFAGRLPGERTPAERRAKIYLHRIEAHYLKHPRAYTPRGMTALQHPFSAFLFWGGAYLYPVEGCAADVLLQDKEIVDSPIGPLRVLFSPGHTPGHIAYFRESDGLLFSGDAVINIVPIWLKIKLNLPLRVFSSDWNQTKQSARLMASLHPSLLLSGHGPPLTRDTTIKLQAFADSL